MCTVCGCGGGMVGIAPPKARPRPGKTLGWRPGTAVAAVAGPEPPGLAPGPGLGPVPVQPAGPGQARLVQLEADILARNYALAAANRRWLAARGILAVNLLSSPGSGKTALLVRTLQALAGRLPAAVIEGDQQTELDAQRIRATGAPAVQINTGRGCHLDAAMVGRALPRLDPPRGGLVFIENVGNLVCPAAFDLGEAHKVVVLSVTEGEDKPLKYPDMFAAAHLLLVNKVDLLPYLDFDVGRALELARRINPRLPAILTSATTGAGLAEWLAWLEARRPAPAAESCRG